LTLADLVADVRAPTPSAAAERVLPARRELQARVVAGRQRLLQAGLALVGRQRALLQWRRQRLLHPRRRLEFLRIRCDDWLQRLLSVGPHLLERRRQQVIRWQARLSVWAGGAATGLLRARLDHARARLEQAGRRHLERNRVRVGRLELRLQGVSPVAVLQRGYAIVHDQRGVVARRVDALQVGEHLRVVLARGELTAIIHQLKETPCSDSSA
ncbi:MAG: hypothetical protein H7838_11420, partial [Magnetococcus sp. DMHC-8]